MRYILHQRKDVPYHLRQLSYIRVSSDWTCKWRRKGTTNISSFVMVRQDEIRREGLRGFGNKTFNG